MGIRENSFPEGALEGAAQSSAAVTIPGGVQSRVPRSPRWVSNILAGSVSQLLPEPTPASLHHVLDLIKARKEEQRSVCKGM